MAHQISELMTRDIETVSPESSAQEAARFMVRADTGSIPVLENDRLVGMITDRDIAIRGVAEGKGPDCAVRDLMSGEPICAHEDDDVQSVAERMAEAQVRRLPVLDRDEKLVGMVSLGDLARETSGESAHRALEGVSAESGQQDGSRR